MNNKLYYTVESVLAELAWLICHNAKLSPRIVNFYKELQNMHQNSEFDIYIKQYDLNPDELTEDLKEEYYNILDIFLEDLIQEASETNVK